MDTKLNVLNASSKFDDVLTLLKKEGHEALSEISNFFMLSQVDIVISPASKEYKTDSGILGCVSTPYVIDILLDTDRKDLKDIIRNELASVIAHEIHHLVRSSRGVQEETLFQVLVSEGLACHFETYFNGNKSPQIFEELKDVEWLELYKLMESDLDNRNFDYPLYFGGKDESKLPNRAGYWVGFNLVLNYIIKHGGCAVTLAGSPAEVFV